MDVQHDSEIEELITQRDHCLPSIISSFSDAKDNLEILKNVKQCTIYLPTYNILNIETELLQYVIPVIKKCLQKAYEDNFLMSDTVDDDFVLNILKENLQIALAFIQIMKIILEFLSQTNQINLNELNSTSTNMAKLILLTFEHCKNSNDEYKTTFNLELLEIFRITQEVHLLFVKLFESCIVIKEDPYNIDEINVFRQVLEMICSMSEILSALNIKSMSDNWKGYAAITQKFTNLLSDTIDLKLPMQILTTEIFKNMKSLDDVEEVDLKSNSTVIKITGFLIKVALKILENFQSCMGKIPQELLNFCCTIYSFPSELYCAQGHPPDTLDLIERLLFNPLEPFLVRLLNDAAITEVFSSQNLASCEYSFGLINFLNTVLQLLVLNCGKLTSLRIDVIVRNIFNNVKLCYTQFFWTSILGNLAVNIAAAVIVYDECFNEVEGVLFENLLQEDIWSAFLALEVWTLLLCNSTPQICLETLSVLIKKHQDIDFGLHTNRLEQVYVKCLIQRIFKMLPTYMKTEVVQTFKPVKNIHTLKVIELNNFPVLVEDICTATLDRIYLIESGSCSVKDLTFVGEHLAVLSTVKFNKIGLNSTKLVSAVHKLWDFNVDHSGLTSNNLFKYFMVKLCKITSSLVEEFDNKQVINVLNQLKALSADDFYRLLVCDLLFALCRNKPDYSQDRYKVCMLITNIIYPNLLSSKEGVIKQTVFEVIHNLAISENRDIVRNIMRVSNEMQGQISSYLQRNMLSKRFDKDYFTLLGSFKFQHECIQWRRNESEPRFKKSKIEESPAIEEQRDLTRESAGIIKTVPKVESVEDKTENITEVLDGIKGEVKCLVNILKTEKLSRKNASDIKIIANQLLSLL